METLVRDSPLPDLLSSLEESLIGQNPARTPFVRQHRYAHRSLQFKRAERLKGRIIWRNVLPNLERVKEEEIGWLRPASKVPLRRDCLPSQAVRVFWLEERKRGAMVIAMVTLGVSLSCGQHALAEAPVSPKAYFTQSEHVVVDDTAANLSHRELVELQALRVPANPSPTESNGVVSLKVEERREAGISKVVVVPISCSPSNLVTTAAAVGSATIVGSSQHVVSSLPGASQLLTRVLQHLGGGGVAGAVGATVVYPLDTIKTRFQAQSKNDGKNKNALDCFRQLLVEEGLGSLYNGLLPQLLGIAPEKALKLTVNELMLGILEQHLPGARLWALEIIAGGGGGLSQVLVTNPMEIVKLRLQIQSKVTSPKGLWDMIRELGLRGLYSGSGITLARDVPSSAIFFACYTLITQMYPDQRFWAGFLAAIPATVLVTPLDVIKTRLQMETLPGQEPYKDAVHCCRVLLQQEGLKGLFRGGLLRVLRTSPQFGITLMIYSLFCNGC